MHIYNIRGQKMKVNQMKKATKEFRIINSLFQILLLLGFSLLSVSIISAETLLYLKGDDVPIAALSENAPTVSSLPNYGPGRNSYPGLLIEKGGNGMFETDPIKYQQWISTTSGISLNGNVSLIFWSAMKDFGKGKRGIVEAFLLDCDSSGFDCSLIAQSQRDIFDWSGGWGAWQEYSIDFGKLTYAVPSGRSLAVKIIVGANSDDHMWFAYDSISFPSRLIDNSPSDIVIDSNFNDWFDDCDTHFNIIDEGGANDWASPAKLDITQFAISSNLVDAFHLLIGFDDVSPQSATAATLIDNDFDGNANYAFVATLDGADSNLELYSCDDTISYGCGEAIIDRIYPQSFFATGVASGPWDSDSFLEAVLPFHDLDAEKGSPVIVAPLVSYAAKSLLTSPKDSILGTFDQNYFGGIYYNSEDGSAKVMSSLGSNFVIRRHTDPSQVRTADPHSIVTRAPFDDFPGSLDDGESYYYVVEKEGGLPMNISVHSNSHDNTVRISFDDHDSMSASVDASLSTVTLDTSTIPADGTSSIMVTIFPRDSNGMAIGSGCDVSVDEIQLSPGNQAGPVKDNQDGNYTFEVVSINSGIADVVVIVEGIELDSQHTVTFTDYSPDMLPQNTNQNILNSSHSVNAGKSSSSNNINSNEQNIPKNHSKNSKTRFYR